MRHIVRASSPKLLLASGSPRRRELLTETGFEFEIARPRGAESETRALSMRELTTLNATRKAFEIARTNRESVVLAADTLVSLEGEVIGKPADFDHAIQIVERLSGRTHQVCTGVFICAAAMQKTKSFAVVSHVTFREVDRPAIISYLQKIDPLDKAGAYAAQGNGAEIIASIDGSFTNVVGLPMDETISALADFGVRPRVYAGTAR
jgi:septum formation protein